MPGRIAILLDAGGEPIPRDVWGSPGRDGIPGMFQQSMIYLYGLTKIQDTEYDEIIVNTVTTSKNGVLLKSGSNTLFTVDEGQKLEYLGEITNGGIRWVRVRYNNQVAYVRKEDVILK